MWKDWLSISRVWQGFSMWKSNKNSKSPGLRFNRILGAAIFCRFLGKFTLIPTILSSFFGHERNDVLITPPQIFYWNCFLRSNLSRDRLSNYGIFESPILFQQHLLPKGVQKISCQLWTSDSFFIGISNMSGLLIYIGGKSMQEFGSFAHWFSSDLILLRSSSCVICIFTGICTCRGVLCNYYGNCNTILILAIYLKTQSRFQGN